MAIPDIQYVRIPVIQEYLAAKTAYDRARGAVIDAFSGEVRRWYEEDGWTDDEARAHLRLYVPEELHTDILVAAYQAAVQVRDEAAEDLRQLLALGQDQLDEVTAARVRAALHRVDGDE